MSDLDDLETIQAQNAFGFHGPNGSGNGQPTLSLSKPVEILRPAVSLIRETAGGKRETWHSSMIRGWS